MGLLGTVAILLTRAQASGITTAIKETLKTAAVQGTRDFAEEQSDAPEEKFIDIDITNPFTAEGGRSPVDINWGGVVDPGNFMETLYVAPAIGWALGSAYQARYVPPAVATLVGVPPRWINAYTSKVLGPRSVQIGATTLGPSGLMTRAANATRVLNPYMYLDMGVLLANSTLKMLGIKDDDPESLTDILFAAGSNITMDSDTEDPSEQIAQFGAGVLDVVNPINWLTDDDSRYQQATDKAVADYYDWLGYNEAHFDNVGTMEDKRTQTVRNIAEHGLIGSAWDTATGDSDQDGIAQTILHVTEEERQAARTEATTAQVDFILAANSMDPLAIAATGADAAYLTTKAAAKEALNLPASQVDFLGTLAENTIVGIGDFFTGSKHADAVRAEQENMTKWELADQRQQWERELQDRIDQERYERKLSEARENMEYLIRSGDIYALSPEMQRDLLYPEE